MAVKKKTKVRTLRKLETDFWNFIFKPIAIVVNPWLAIVLFALSLWFSYQHNAVHIYGTENKPLTDPEQEEHRKNKRRIIMARMGFDVMGLIFSIIALGVQLAYATYTLRSVIDVLLIVAAVGLTASSIMSTLHKTYRFFKPGYGEKWYARDTFRVIFGIAGTVILAGLLFHFIPQSLANNPSALAISILIMTGLGIHKMYRIYVERKEYAERLYAIESVNKTQLSFVVSQEQLELFKKIEKDGDYNFSSILDARIEDILRLLSKENISSSTVQTDHELVKQFFDTFDIDIRRISKLINKKFILHKDTLEKCLTDIMGPQSAEASPKVNNRQNILILPPEVLNGRVEKPPTKWAWPSLFESKKSTNIAMKPIINQCDSNTIAAKSASQVPL